MSTKLTFTRTRIAPTPSGYLHLGNVLSFAVTATLARQYGASILLRIDDLDRARVRKEYVQDIFDTLEFLEIPWDEGPRSYRDYEETYSQVHRMKLYGESLASLRCKGHLFACDCSRADVLRAAPDGGYPGTCLHRSLSFSLENTSWRMDTSIMRDLLVKNLSGDVVEATLPPSMQFFVVRKKDGFPAYQLASVVDDEHFGVDLVVRGVDLWKSTLAQLYLAQVLGYERFVNTSFVHHPLLMDTAGDKLSKSAGATSIRHFRKQGKTKEAIYAMIGELSGLSISVSNWQELGTQYLNENGLAGELKIDLK